MTPYRRNCLRIAFMALFCVMMLLLIGYSWSHAASELPSTIRATVPLTAVVCHGPVCCGQAQVVYRGHWYDAPLGYCKWFRPLRNGQQVTLTLTLAR